MMHALSGLLWVCILMRTPAVLRERILGHTCPGSLNVYCFRKNHCWQSKMILFSIVKIK